MNKLKLEDLVCAAYAYLECNNNIDLYEQEYGDGKPIIKLLKDWEDCKKCYINLSEYLTDNEIKNLQNFVILER